MSYLSDANLSSAKMFQIVPNSILVFTITLNFFGAKIDIAEI
jgi:hypothetical protein